MSTMNYRVTKGADTLARFVHHVDALRFAQHLAEETADDPRMVMVIERNGSLVWCSSHLGRSPGSDTSDTGAADRERILR